MNFVKKIFDQLNILKDKFGVVRSDDTEYSVLKPFTYDYYFDNNFKHIQEVNDHYINLLSTKIFDQTGKDLDDKHFTDDELIILEKLFADFEYSDSVMDSYLKKTHSINLKDVQLEIFNYIDTENILKLLNIKCLESFNAYGAGSYLIDNEEVTLFSTYDNGTKDVSYKDYIVTTLYFYQKGNIEIADIVYNFELDIFEIVNHKRGYTDLDLNIRCRKRPFNYYPDENYLSHYYNDEWIKIELEDA